MEEVKKCGGSTAQDEEGGPAAADARAPAEVQGKVEGEVQGEVQGEARRKCALASAQGNGEQLLYREAEG